MWRIVLLYALFAVLSIAVNIGTQIASIVIYRGPAAVSLSMLLGTATGLIIKYVLDKRWIFGHVSSDRVHEARTFVLYAAMGVVTTGVFWGTELAFHFLFASDVMRYSGGVVGLIVGYLIKYWLDRRWVFAASPHRS